MNRRGVALVLVLIALLITAVLAAGVLITTATITRASGDTQHALRVSEGAERGVITAAVSWPPESTLTMPVGATIGPQIVRHADSTTSTSWITRLSGGSFWVTARARGPVTGVRVPIERRIGSLYVLHVPEPTITAAVSVADSLLVSGSARVDGNDASPPGWGAACNTTGPTVAGVAAADTSRVCDGACSAPAGVHIVGSPHKTLDSTLSMSTLNRLGAVTWTSLTAHATRAFVLPSTVTPAPRLTGMQCDSTVASNWGDPTRSSACANHFVIVHAQAPLVMDGGVGQGIVVADADVELRNGAQFFGVILTRDDFVATVGSNRVWGAVIAADGMAMAGDHSVIAGSTVVTFSSCAVEMSLLGTAHLRRELQRGWIPLH